MAEKILGARKHMHRRVLVIMTLAAVGIDQWMWVVRETIGITATA